MRVVFWHRGRVNPDGDLFSLGAGDRAVKCHVQPLRRSVLAAVILACLVCSTLVTPLSAQSASGLTSPDPSATLSGTVAVRGAADHATFRKWQVDLVLEGADGHATFLALGDEPVSGELFRWDTTAYPDGNHQLRLRVVHSNLNYDEYFTPVALRNGNAVRSVTAPAEAIPVQAAPVTVELPKPPPSPAAAPDAARWIEVDISDQRLIAWQQGEAVFDYTVSTGKPGFRTLPGEFAVYRKYDETRMRGYDYDTPDVPWTMYYSGAFAIHGAYWHEDFGTPVSHGCINLPVEQAKALYEWADVGTVVVVRQ